MKISNETKIGAFTLIAITILVLGYNYLNGRVFFSKTNVLKAEYEQVSGLKKGNPVQLKGFVVGRITDIDLEQNGKLLVTASFDQAVDIPVNSVFRIVSFDILGAKGISIILGDSTRFAVSGDTIRGEVEQSLAESVNAQVAPVKSKAERLIASMDSLVESMQGVLTPEFRRDFAHSVQNVSRSLDNFSVSIDRLNTITKNVESISANLRNNNDRITAILANMHNISDSLAAANIKQTINNANRAIQDFAMITAKINRGEGSMGLLLKDQKLYDNLNSSALDLDQLILDIRNNPKRYISFSVFGRKDKEPKKK